MGPQQPGYPQGPGYPQYGTPGPYGFGPPPTRAKLSGAAVVAVFVGVLLGLAILAAIVVFAQQPQAPEAPCEPGRPCAPQPSLPPISQVTPGPTLAPTAAPTPSPSPSPTAQPSGQPSVAPTSSPSGPTPQPTATPGSDSPPLLSGELWRSEALGYSFEYDPSLWQLTESADDRAVFTGSFFDAQVIIHAVDGATSPEELIQQELATVDERMIGRVLDRDDYDALLGPSIGYIRGEGHVYSGTMTSEDGTPTTPGGVTVLASTDGRLTVSMVIVVFDPDAFFYSGTLQHVVRSSADQFLKSFDWGSQ